MADGNDIERILEAGRITTTNEQDERVLTAAGRALRRGRVLRSLPRLAAAGLLLGFVVLAFAMKGGGGGTPGSDSFEVAGRPDPGTTFNRSPVHESSGNEFNGVESDVNILPDMPTPPGSGDRLDVELWNKTERASPDPDGKPGKDTGRQGGLEHAIDVARPDGSSGTGGSEGGGEGSGESGGGSSSIYGRPAGEVPPSYRPPNDPAPPPPDDAPGGGDAGGPAAAPEKVLSVRPMRLPGRIGESVRGLGGDKGPVAKLEDITNGLEGTAATRFDSSERGLYSTPVNIPPAPGTETYDRIVANDFRDPRHEPLSTFSIDVDSAAYANVRRFLMQGSLPPPDAVRIEEMVNYFSYSYPQADDEQPFAVVTEVATCPWNPRSRLVHIGIQGRRIDASKIPPRNLVFLLDVSGSMRPQNKLPLVKSAMKLLVGQLGEADHVGIVTYAGNSGVALQPTSCGDRPRVMEAIDRLRAGGSTNAGSGIQLAYEMARKHFEKNAINRVILATDGDFNVGITDRKSLEDLITREREGGVFLTVLGVGSGNLKDSQMEMLADKGNGNYAYLDSILEAERVLVRQASATLLTLAKDVKLQVEFNPAKVGAYRLVGYENRILAARDFNDDRKDAGEIGAGHSVTALFEIVPAGSPRAEVPPIDDLRYQDRLEPVGELADEILTLKIRYKQPDGDRSELLRFPLTDPGKVPVSKASDDFAFSSAVASFGMLLRRSPHARALSFALIREIAQGAVGEDPHGDRKEFLRLVEIAERLAR